MNGIFWHRAILQRVSGTPHIPLCLSFLLNFDRLAWNAEGQRRCSKSETVGKRHCGFAVRTSLPGPSTCRATGQPRDTIVTAIFTFPRVTTKHNGRAGVFIPKRRCANLSSSLPALFVLALFLQPPREISGCNSFRTLTQTHTRSMWILKLSYKLASAKTTQLIENRECEVKISYDCFHEKYRKRPQCFACDNKYCLNVRT